MIALNRRLLAACAVLRCKSEKKVPLIIFTLPFEKQTFLKSDWRKGSSEQQQHQWLQKSVLPWNNLFGLVLSSLLHVCSLSIVSQAVSLPKCACIHQNDNRLHFQTFTTFFISVVRLYFYMCVFIFTWWWCGCMCARVSSSFFFSFLR